MWLEFLALSPGIAFVWWLSGRASVQSFSKTRLLLLFIGGMLSTRAALVLNHALEKYTRFWPGTEDSFYNFGFWLLGPGLNEEWVKMLVLMLFIYRRNKNLSLTQGLLASSAVACGFAIVENLIYLEQYGSATILPRTLFSLPAHITFSAWIAYGIVRSLRSSHGALRYGWLLFGLLMACLLHGSYNILLLFEATPSIVQFLAYFQVLFMSLFWWSRWRRAHAALMAA